MISVYLELVAASLLVAHGVWTGPRVMNSVGPGHLARLLAFLTSLTFGIGPWLSFLYGGLSLPQEPLEPLVLSYAAVGAFVLACEVTGLLAAGKSPHDRKSLAATRAESAFRGFVIPHDFRIAVVYAAVVVTRIYYASEYGILFSGSGTGDRMAQMTYTAVVVYQMIPILGGACLLAANLSVWRPRSMAGFVCNSLVIATEFAWLATQGRRQLIEAVVVGLLAYRYSGRRVGARELTVVGGVVAVLWFVVFPTFLAARTALMTHPDPESPFSALRTETESGVAFDPQVARERHAANASARLLIIRFIVRISEDQASRPFMNGSALATSLSRAVPALVLGSKAASAAPELAIQEFYGQPSGDTSTTWPAVGMADFGIAGAFLAGLVFASVLELARRVGTRSPVATPFGLIILQAFSIHCCVFVEECPSALWSGLRNIVILLMLGWCLIQILGLKRQTRVGYQGGRWLRTPGRVGPAPVTDGS